MKAIVMAGGQGTRLRAVTGELPKPMVPLLGRPLMEHILLLLRQHGFDEVCAALCYHPERIREAFGDGSALGLKLCYRTETEPLGTAGAVRNCAEFIGEEDVLVISGDAACDFDLSALWRRHRESGAAVTLALARQSEPLRFGLAVTDGRGAVRAFVEKPPWRGVVSDLVNTGIYVLSPEALRAIPSHEVCDFAKDLFPRLLREGRLLLGVPMEGYWCDVGTPLSYYQCCVDALQGKLRLTPGEAFQPGAAKEDAEPEEEAQIRIDCPCRSRAALMGALSELMLELDADFDDGIRLRRSGYSLHIAPRAEESAVRISANAADSEFARSLALSAKEIVEALAL